MFIFMRDNVIMIGIFAAFLIIYINIGYLLFTIISMNMDFEIFKEIVLPDRNKVRISSWLL